MTGDAPLILVTGGPTREYVDDVRFISNVSSGRMGIELARAALDQGCRAHLILGPAEIVPPQGAAVTRVISAADMLNAVQGAFAQADVFIAAAAVADYTPAVKATGKLKKSREATSLALIPAPDILAWAGDNRRAEQILVGFALETDSDLAKGYGKLEAKHCDLLVHNTLENTGAGGGPVHILNHAGVCYEGRPSKPELARIIVDFVARLRTDEQLPVLRQRP